LEAPWEEELFSHPDAGVQTVEGKTIYKGLRVRMGIHTGEPISETDPVTKRTGKK